MIAKTQDAICMLSISMALFLSVMDFAQLASAETLKVGVRKDAPPFSYYASDGAVDTVLMGMPTEHGFDGYMVRVCEYVLQGLDNNGGIEVETHVVDAGNRFSKLKNGTVHILCDPATITPERLRGALASTPIYMSAVTYAAPDPLPPKDPSGTDCANIVGLVGDTTAYRGIWEILNHGSWPRFGGRIKQELESMESGGRLKSLEARAPSATCSSEAIKFYETHDLLAKDFCEQSTIYYVGDVEIIRSKIKEYGCLEAINVAPAIYTDERYAIYTALPGASDDKVPSKLILRFLAELSRQLHNESESVLVRVFNEINKGKDYKASEKLKTFLWSITGDYPD